MLKMGELRGHGPNCGGVVTRSMQRASPSYIHILVQKNNKVQDDNVIVMYKKINFCNTLLFTGDGQNITNNKEH